MRGDLSFSGDFECGNVGPVERVSLWEWVIMVRPDSHNERQRLWFDFKVSNTEAGQRVLFTLPNMSKGKSMYREGFTPLVRSLKRPTWQRMPSDQVLYYRVPKKRGYTLAFFFCFDDPSDEYEFAYSFPYTYSDLQRFLCRKDLAHGGGAGRIDASTTDNSTSAQQPIEASPPRSTSRFVYRRELLCRTPMQRRVDLLTITSSQSKTINQSALSPSHGAAEAVVPPAKRFVFISARIHPGETPASFIMHGLVDFLTSRDPRAELLRDHVVFKVVPMLNPDGVFLGNYRSNAFGYDLNRFWATPHPILHPEVHATRALLLSLNQRPTSTVHGDSGSDGARETDEGSSSSACRSSSSTPANAFNSGAYVHETSLHGRRPSAASTTTRMAAGASAGASAAKVEPSSSSPSHTQAPGRAPSANANANEGTLDFFVDLHAHSAAASAFMYANAVEVPLPIDAATEAQAAQADRDAAIHKAWHASVASLGASSTSGTPTSTMPTTAAATTASTGAAVLRPTAISSSAAGTGAAAYGLSSTTPSSGGGEASHPNYPCHPTRSTRPGALPDPQLDVERSLALWAWEAALPKALSQRSAAISSSSGGGAFSMHYTRFDADPSKEGTGRRALREALGSSVRCYTLETSFHGYEVNNRSPNAASTASQSSFAASATGANLLSSSSSNAFSTSSKGGRLAHFTPEKWMELGRDLALTFLDLYGLKTTPTTTTTSTSTSMPRMVASTTTTRSAPTTPPVDATSTTNTSSMISIGPRRAISAASLSALSSSVPLFAGAGLSGKTNSHERASSTDLLSVSSSSSNCSVSRQRSTLNPLVPGLPPSQARRTTQPSQQGAGGSRSSSTFGEAAKMSPLGVKVSGTSRSSQPRSSANSSGFGGRRKLI